MWQVIGQDRVVALLQRSLEEESLAHAYLLVGPPHVGKMTLALNLAQALNCEANERPCGECASCQKIVSANHADVQVIGLNQNVDSAESKLRAEIGIDQIRQMQHSASLPPFEGKYKIFIIEGAEFLSAEAANCLLKTLEEPIGKVIFILLTANDRLLPATVVSRCQRLELSPLTANEVEAALSSSWGVELQKAKLLARLSRGCLGWALSAASDDGLLQQRAEKIDKLLEITSADYEERFAYATQLAAQFSQNRGVVQEVLNLWLDWWHDLLLVKIGCNDIITNIDQLALLIKMAKGYQLAQIRDFINSIQAAGEQLRQNANPRLVLEVLMLDMPEKEGRSQKNLTARL
ncbi:MAG: ATP-binding protein [Dehalococcoidales bacterium]